MRLGVLPKFEWSPTRHRAADLLATLDDSRSYGDIATELDVDPDTLLYWRKSPEFMREVDRLLDERKRMLREPALKALLQNVRDGDQAAINTALKITGDLSGDGVNVQTHIHQAEAEDRPPPEVTDDELLRQIEHSGRVLERFRARLGMARPTRLP